MTGRLKQIVADSRVPVRIVDFEGFRPLPQPADARWEVSDGGAIYATGPVRMPATRMQITGENRVFLEAGSRFYGSKFMVSGKNCNVYIGARCRLTGATIRVAGEDCNVIIGEQTTWESGIFICGNKSMHIVVGNDCMLSSEVMIRTNDGHGIFERDTKELINETKSVEVESHVWIGNAARVNKGVRLGTSSVLGGFSIATADLEPNSVYAGVPARKIRDNIVWSRSYSYDGVPGPYR